MHSHKTQGPVAAESQGVKAHTSCREILSRVARRTFTPLTPTAATPPSPGVAWSVRHIVRNYAKPVTLNDLAHGAGLSKFHFTRKFRNETGITPIAFLQRYRICRAMDQLVQSRRTVSAIAREVGYRDAAAFSRAFLKTVGAPPLLYRQTRHTQTP